LSNLKTAFKICKRRSSGIVDIFGGGDKVLREATGVLGDDVDDFALLGSEADFALLGNGADFSIIYYIKIIKII